MGCVYDSKVAAEARKLAAEHLDNALLTNPPKLNVGMAPRAGKSVLAGRVHGGGERVGPVDKVWVDELFERKDDPRYTLYPGPELDKLLLKPAPDPVALDPGVYCQWRDGLAFSPEAITAALMDNAMLVLPPGRVIAGVDTAGDDVSYTVIAHQGRDGVITVLDERMEFPIKGGGLLPVVERCTFIESPVMQARPVRRSQRRAGPAHPWRWPGSRAKR